MCEGERRVANGAVMVAGSGNRAAIMETAEQQLAAKRARSRGATSV
jgi:hypothetical protein